MKLSKPLEEVTFRVGPLVNLLPVVRSFGVDPDAILVDLDVDPRDFRNPDHRISYLLCDRFISRCVEETGCDHLGLLVGMQAQPSHLGLTGFLCRAAPTVEHALKTLVQNIDLHEEGGVLTLSFEPEFVTLQYAVLVPGLHSLDQISELSVTFMHRTMQFLCGENWRAAQVRLERPEPADPRPYRQYFQADVYFNSAETSVMMSRDCLARQPPSADSLLFKYLLNEAKALHKLQHRELIDELPAALRRGLLNEKFSAHDIAEMFGIHERTLHRRLRAARTSFRVELDKARMDISHQLLENTTLPVSSIATALGYADSSGFIRAFRRWCGTCPSSWRNTDFRG